MIKKIIAIVKKIFRKRFKKSIISKSDTRDFSDLEIKIWQSVLPYTMTSVERVKSLIDSVNYISDNSIEGDFVECGVWKGGSVMTMILTLQKFNKANRTIWLYDTFEGMTNPDKNDLKYDGTPASELLKNEIKRTSQNWARCQLEEVKKNISTLKYPDSNLHFIKGPVEETLCDTVPEKISILRLDTDWYNSTKIELEVLFPKLVKGGILIIDDYGHFTGCKQAVDEYLSCLKESYFLHRIDYTGRLLIKH